MSDRVVVPDIITQKVHEVLRRHEGYPHPDSGDSGRLLILAVAVCETFAKALSQHPIVPTDEQIEALHREVRPCTNRNQLIEWQRRMFRAPEPEVPEVVDPIEFLFEELLDLTQMVAPHEIDKIAHMTQVLDRYRLGLRGKPVVP